MTMHGQAQGLSAQEVLESRRVHGANVLTPVRRTPPWRLYVQKFRDPMILILLVALLFSFGVSYYGYAHLGEGGVTFFEPLGILCAVLLATGISFFFEQKADREFNLLNQVNDEVCYKCLREGHLHEVPKQELVVGDVVLLDTGEEVPADGQLLEAVSLQVNESSLTGEPMAVKSADPAQADPEATYPSNCLYRGSVVIDGHGTMRITAVGDASEAGRVFRGIQIEDDVETPLNRQLRRLAHMISKVGYVLAVLVVLGRLWSFFHAHGTVFEWFEFGSYLLNTLMLAVTLLVVAVPEGLPMSISLSLAYSMRSMMATNNLVRRMHACETMGATTVICTDKTGTLTQNQMRVADVLLCDGAELTPSSAMFGPIAESMACNGTAHLEADDAGRVTVLGNPTEGALLLWLRSHGVEYLPLRDGCTVAEQLTFSTERKYMGTLLHGAEGDAMRLLIKGAPEIVVPLCSFASMSDGSHQPMAELWEPLRARLEEYQAQGMRTLALAACNVPKGTEPFREGVVTEQPLCLLALVVINDPVRADVPQAIRECRDAGIQVKIVTGDTLLTTREIARQIGLWDETCGDDAAMSGTEFEAMRDEELLPRLPNLRIMYRARPMDKARLTALLQSQGEVVAVTGDGTNDAPALRAAHVGLSMGDGTAVAKEASDITILDNSFVSIGRAVMWGRSLYQNIQRFIVFQLTINVSACLVVLIGAFTGQGSPLTITQMLWINLIMDTFAALALASLPPDPSVMKRKPRGPGEFIITPSMRNRIVGVGLVFVVLLFGVLLGLARLAGEERALMHELYDAAAAHTGAAIARIGVYELSVFFSLFVFMQVWNLFNARALGTMHSALHGVRHARRFLMVVGVITLGQLLMMNFGGAMFNVVPLHWDDQLLIVLLTSLVLWVGELGRLFSRWRKRSVAA